ncbi:VIT1/CCC1 transporter family protein [Patescibacteria group bacterium]|nr:VIT1/CCC1 transporter family protein [Patescibacteria group bacterium]MBU1673512.1 VIT1/CCC1 transporter family protein [Patescibacteria group bacterium]MBU1963742.1 VIT1/CCC1 transporter family protein [Patescibacteria group bacterium]
MEKSRAKLIHNQKPTKLSAIREIIFGMQDGMVSTLGAITGIAVGSQDKFMVILSGIVIISVESISMGIGSYVANKSEKGIDAKKLEEESSEIDESPHTEKEELANMYKQDGWPEKISKSMADTASKDKQLMLKEMSLRELNLSGKSHVSAFKLGIFMFFSYIIGGFIPLCAYFFLPISASIYISIVCTMLGLFLLGSITSRYTVDSWLKSGLRILILGGIALIVGYLAGRLVNYFGGQSIEF